MKIILNDDDIIVVDGVELSKEKIKEILLENVGLSTFVQTTFKEGGVSNKHY